MNPLKSLLQKVRSTRPAASHLPEGLGHRRTLLAAGIFGVVALAVLLAFDGRSSTSPGTAGLTRSVELTEDAGHYTVTVAGIDPDNVRVALDGRTLHIVSGRAAQGTRAEQSFQLPAADLRQSPALARANDRLVITVPKAAEDAAPARVGAATPARPAPALSQRDPDPIARQINRQFALMQRQMDAIFGGASGLPGPADPFAALSASPGSIQVEDQGSGYVVRAPGITAQAKVDIAVDDGRRLKITARDESSSGGNSRRSYRQSQFTQVVTLPGEVRSEKMTIQHEGDDLLITLPKA